MTKSIISNEKECFLCGRQINLERHHIMAGTANRKLSEKYGLWVYLCHDCHTGVDGAQYNAVAGLELKQTAQRVFENKYSHEFWMDVFRKNYL